MRWMGLRSFIMCLAALAWGGAAASPPDGAASVPPSVASPSDAQIAQFMDEFVSQAMREHDFPGVGLVVKREGRTVLAKGYGIVDYETQRPLRTDSTLIPQGSITKLLVWILAMQLVEEGRLDLDRDVSHYLGFEVPRTFAEPVTMRHLMTHTSGFSERFYMVSVPHKQQDLRSKLIGSMPARVYPPGARVAYSNYGAALAAHVVERVHGEPFEVLAQRRILGPLGMRGSTVQQPVPAELKSRMASVYGALARSPQGVYQPPLAAAGSLAATADDMGRLLDALMTPAGDSPALLRPATLAQMQTLHRPLVDGLDAGLGLGFIVGRYRGVAHAGHGASMPAGAAELQVLPEHGLGWSIAFTGRGREGAANPIRQEMLRAVIDRFYAKPLPKAPKVDVTDSASAARSAEGEYLSARRGHRGIVQLAELFTGVRLRHEDGTLVLQHEGTSTPLQMLDAGRWRDPATGQVLAVQRDADGRVVAMASTMLSTVATLEPASARTPVARVIVIVAPLLLLGIALGRPLGAAVRRMRRNGPSQPAWVRGNGRASTRWTRVAFALVVGVLLAWMALLLHTVLDARAPARWGVAFMLLNALSLTTLPAAAWLAWHAASRWRDVGSGIRQRILATLAAAAAASLAWVYLAYGFTTFSLEF